MPELRLLWLKDDGFELSYYENFFSVLGVKELFIPNITTENWSLYSSLKEIDLSGVDNDALIAVNWQTPLVFKSLQLIDSTFDVVILPAGSEHLSALAASFSGEIYVDLQDDDLENSLSLVSKFQPSLLERVREIGSRIKFIYNNRESDFRLHPFLSNRVLHVPLSLKFMEPSRSKKQIDVLIIANDERLNDGGFSKRKALESCVKGLSLCVTGEQSIAIQNIDNFVQASLGDELNELLARSKVIVHTGCAPVFGRDKFLLEALASQTPVLMLHTDGALNSSMISRESVFGSLRKLRKAIRRLLNGDENLLSKIVDAQNDKIRRNFLSPDNDELLDNILSARSIHTPLSRKTTSKVAVFSTGDLLSLDYLRAKQIAFCLKEKLKGTHEIILFVKTNRNVHLPAEDKTAISIREYSWGRLSRDMASAAMNFSGALLDESWDEFVVPDDGINCCGDCDLWFFVSENIPGRLLQLKSTVINVQGFKPDRLYIDSGASTKVSNVFNLQAANSLISNDQQSFNFLKELAPSSTTDINFLSDIFTSTAFNNKTLTSCDLALHDNYLLIFAEGVETKNLIEVILMIVFVQQYKSFKTKVIVVGIDSESVTQLVDSSSYLQYKRYVKEIQKYLSNTRDLVFHPHVSEESRWRLIHGSRGVIHLDKTSSQSLNRYLCMEFNIPIFLIPSSVNFKIAAESKSQILDLESDVLQENVVRLLSGQQELLLSTGTEQLFRSVQERSHAAEVQYIGDSYSSVITKWT